MTKNFTVFLIRSNFNSDNNAIIEINLTKCRGNGCKSDTEINYFIATHVVEIAMISSYFDVNDYDNPVHSYLQDTNLYSLIPAFSQKIVYKIQLNQLNLGDGIYFGSQGIQEDLEFYSIERSSSVMSALEVDYTFIQILITLDQKVNQYQRTVYSFLELFGFLGGVFQIFELMGGFVVNIFTSRYFYSSILPKLYHLEQDNKVISQLIKYPRLRTRLKSFDRNTTL